MWIGYNQIMIFPTYTKELGFLSEYKYIAGIDEVGRGPLAGPVVSAVVILDPARVGKYRSRSKWWSGVRDSKTLTAAKRLALGEFVKENALDFAIGIATHQEIDELNIHYASLLAMRRAIENLEISPELLLIDGKFKIPRISMQQKTVIDGDAKVLSIAAASIIAKVYRDDLMQKYSEEFPHFGFAKHKGYDTAFHRKQLLRRGPCPIHRMTFETVKGIMNTRFEKMKRDASSDVER